jgi:hypothetical protein
MDPDRMLLSCNNYSESTWATRKAVVLPLDLPSKLPLKGK